MGDRYDRKRAGLGERMMRRHGKPPPSLLAWGLEAPASIGHNNGPPLDDDAPGYVWRRYRWKKVHAKAWETPSMGVLRFRIKRAEAAGLDYRTYMLTLLDTGRHAQAKDRDARRASALTTIRAAWAEVMARVAASSSRIDRGIWLSSLIGAYDGEDRHYHDTVHIAAMLTNLAAHGSAVVARDAVMLAILFHDFVYDAQRGDNEAESAVRGGLALAALGVEPALIARMSGMIRATAHTSADVRDVDPDTALLIDLDLAILAAPATEYAAYVSGVRREYGHVADDAFNAGRARVLRHFLDLPRLYRTPALVGLWEARARANLKSELAQRAVQPTRSSEPRTT